MKPDEDRLLSFYLIGLQSKNHAVDTTCTNAAMRFALEAEAVFQRTIKAEPAKEAAST